MQSCNLARFGVRGAIALVVQAGSNVDVQEDYLAPAKSITYSIRTWPVGVCDLLHLKLYYILQHYQNSISSFDFGTHYLQNLFWFKSNHYTSPRDIQHRICNNITCGITQSYPSKQAAVADPTCYHG